MTKPLFEPSTQRGVAGNSWGVSQLFRRPGAPPGTAQPYAYATGANTATAPNDETWTPAGFELLTSNHYPDIFELVVDTGGGTGVYGVSIHVAGIYKLEGQMDYDPYSAAPDYVEMTYNGLVVDQELYLNVFGFQSVHLASAVFLAPPILVQLIQVPFDLTDNPIVMSFRHNSAGGDVDISPKLLLTQLSDDLNDYDIQAI